MKRAERVLVRRALMKPGRCEMHTLHYIREWALLARKGFGFGSEIASYTQYTTSDRVINNPRQYNIGTHMSRSFIYSVGKRILSSILQTLTQS